MLLSNIKMASYTDLAPQRMLQFRRQGSSSEHLKCPRAVASSALGLFWTISVAMARASSVECSGIRAAKFTPAFEGSCCAGQQG